MVECCWPASLRCCTRFWVELRMDEDLKNKLATIAEALINLRDSL